MRISAVICEYNPFHNGHKYQIEKMKEYSDAVIAVMSGPFVQRGEAAITDKFTRAEIAARNGADLVVELPALYAMSSARDFAWGAVSLIEKTGAVDMLVFGSESGDINKLTSAAELIYNEPDEVSEKIQGLMAEGVSYPAAREAAFEGLIEPELLSGANNILAVEYIRALMSIKSSVKPVTLKRTSTDKMISAHKIRKKLLSGEDISAYVPEGNFKIYRTELLDTAVTAALRLMSPQELAQIRDVSEGLENRIKRAAQNHASLGEILDEVKTKRYTMSRLKRIMLSALLGIKKDFAPPMEYLRVLAIGERGAEVLKEIKKTSKLHIITKAADYQRDDLLFCMDLKAQDLFALCAKMPGKEDFRRSPYVIK
ncbi:MAG: nucleotidyltransferase family protein [Clostridiales bacterium]|nr:nucleotidyltransferase family protein [Clostridiales bacterium]